MKITKVEIIHISSALEMKGFLKKLAKEKGYVEISDEADCYAIFQHREGETIDSLGNAGIKGSMAGDSLRRAIGKSKQEDT